MGAIMGGSEAFELDAQRGLKRGDTCKGVFDAARLTTTSVMRGNAGGLKWPAIFAWSWPRLASATIGFDSGRP